MNVSLPLVAIVGRPNVGKSSLFNRILRQKKAITHDRSGVTRDSLFGDVTHLEKPFTLVDTGGIVLETPREMEEEILEQAREAIHAADIILFVVDGREGVTGTDEDVCAYLRQSGKEILLLVNKVDGPEHDERLTAEFYTLGYPLAGVSAAHGYGMSTLVEWLENHVPVIEHGEEDPRPRLSMAMLGRPNAGKSSLINALVGKNRLIVSPVAGTTRDSVDVSFVKEGTRYVFVDTAGIRRRTRIDDDLEHYSVLRALQAARRAGVVVFVLDGSQVLSAQDKRLIAYLDREKIPFLIVVNKTDLIPKDGFRKRQQDLRDALAFCGHAPQIFVSALKGRGVGKIFSLAQRLVKQCSARIGTGELNRFIQLVTERHQPPMVKGRRLKMYYMTQAKAQPPTFVFFVNDPDLVKPSYGKYLENQLRKFFRLDMVPLKIVFRGSHKKK
ncbi:ribosome biogenesis GTPase Der [Desulfoplanes sp.]